MKKIGGGLEREGWGQEIEGPLLEDFCLLFMILRIFRWGGGGGKGRWGGGGGGGD